MRAGSFPVRVAVDLVVSLFIHCGSVTVIAALTCGLIHAETLHDGGGDVSVLLFSTHLLTAVTVTPLSANAWIANCPSCAHKSFAVPFNFSGTRELFAGGKIQVTDSGSQEQRSATGLWHLRSNREGIDVVLTLPSEHYVAAVVNEEAATDEGGESLRALAIVARTYALNGRHFTAAPGHLSPEQCDSTECEALRLGPTSEAIENAVRATAGETLWVENRRAEVFFSEHCGGRTEDAGAVWRDCAEYATLSVIPTPTACAGARLHGTPK